MYIYIHTTTLGLDTPYDDRTKNARFQFGIYIYIEREKERGDNLNDRLTCTSHKPLKLMTK